MISSVTLQGYRGLSGFSMRNLGRINLLVGRNNSGKTSILEALNLLSSGDDLSALWRILSRRGEQAMEIAPNRALQQEADITHLFAGHPNRPGATLSIETSDGPVARSIRYQLGDTKPEESPQLFTHLTLNDSDAAWMTLKISGSPAFSLPPIPISKRGTLRQDIYQQVVNTTRPPKTLGASCQYITTDSLSIGEILGMWNSIVLTPDEERATEALKILEPRIERIAAINAPFFYAGGVARGGFAVRMQGTDQRIPIGSFGDGMWRILALAVALSRAQDSLLLVDEIDTGLHYTVMADMWKLIESATRAYNVQLFATTHSYDCVHSLASICKDVEDAESGITIQRIENGRDSSIPFTEGEIKLAAERQIEIR